MVYTENCPYESQLLENKPVIDRFNALLKAVVSQDNIEIIYFYAKGNLNSYLTLESNGHTVAKQSAAIDGPIGLMKDCIKLLHMANILTKEDL